MSYSAHTQHSLRLEVSDVFRLLNIGLSTEATGISQGVMIPEDATPLFLYKPSEHDPSVNELAGLHIMWSTGAKE